MEYEYKGTIYEFPDDMDDAKALSLIRKDQGEVDTGTVESRNVPIGTTRSFEPLPYEERVQDRADELAMKSLASTQRDPSMINRALAPARQFTGTMTAHLNEALPYKLPGMINKAIPQNIKTLAGTMAMATPVASGIYAGMKAKDAAIPAIAQKAAPVVERMPEKVKNLAGIGMDVAQMIPATYGGTKIGSKGIQGTLKKGGSYLEGKAGRIQGAKVKLRNTKAQRGASNELYTKYGVFGNAKKVKDQWQTKINETYSKLKQKIEGSATAQNPDNYTYINDIFASAEQSAVKYGKSKTGIAKVKRELDKLKEDFIESYPDQKINILDAQLEKQVTGKKGDWLSQSGKISGNPDAAVSAQAHNALYDALKKLVENKGSPGIKELNKQLSEMIPMERAASKQVLVSNRKNPISLDDYIGGLAVAGSAAHGNLLPAAVVAGNVISKSPFTAKGLYGIGKGMKKLENLGNKRITMPSDRTKTVADLLKNQKGSIGGISDDIIGTPAIRDPKTGKIYKGGYRGHKDAIIKGENSSVQERLKWEHFLDNSNKQTPNVGFINKKGEFISRAEAEKIMNQPKSLAQQFHTLGIMAGTGGVAAGGLTAYEKLRERNK